MTEYQKISYGDCCEKKPEVYTYDKDYEKDFDKDFDKNYEKDSDKNFDKDFDKKCKKGYYPPEKRVKCIKVPEVIGRNDCQVLLECVIPFPCNYPAVEIKDIMKEVRNLFIKVCKNKVLINGILHKNINYKTFEDYYKDKCDCSYDTYYGSVKHIGVDIPFSCFIEVPGARPGDDYQVEFAGVEDDCEVDILEDPIRVCDGGVIAYKKVREKVIVKIDLKVLRHVQITIKPEHYNICP
ncbi:MAG: DUF3794 domain-containing protein [Clostridia bacterium]|nr:DUF3794 domain-containing protein [Clostridia bacterium]